LPGIACITSNEHQGAVRQCTLVTLPFNSHKGFAPPDEKYQPAARLGLIINQAAYPRVIQTD